MQTFLALAIGLLIGLYLQKPSSNQLDLKCPDIKIPEMKESKATAESLSACLISHSSILDSLKECNKDLFSCREDRISDESNLEYYKNKSCD